jgi:phosphoglycolate phosphatase
VSQVVLLDLDGTLVDSAPGILASLRRAFAVHRLPPLSAEQERGLLGPPFHESLAPIVGGDQMQGVIDTYREFYAAGAMFDATVYDGIEPLLDWLNQCGVVLAVATSKLEHSAVAIVDHLGLADHFQTVCGDTLDRSRGSKAQVVGEALRRLGSPRADEALMVGDRRHDVIGAAVHGIGCAGAGWGYGSPGELADAGAIAVFQDPIELLEAMPRLLSRVA